jgi:hypothetical protein
MPLFRALAKNMAASYFQSVKTTLRFSHRSETSVCGTLCPRHLTLYTRPIDKLLYLPRPQALIKKFHASHYMKGLHEVVHRDEQPERSFPLPFACL